MEGSAVDEALRRQSGHAVTAAAMVLLVLILAGRLQETLTVVGGRAGFVSALVAFMAAMPLYAATIAASIVVYVKLSRADLNGTMRRASASGR